MFEQFVANVSEAFRSTGKTHVYPWLGLEHPLSAAGGGESQLLNLYVGRSEGELRRLLGLSEGDPAEFRAVDVGSLFGSEDRNGRIVSVLRGPASETARVRRFELARSLAVAMLDTYRHGRLGRASTAWSSSLSRRRSGAFAAELLLPAAAMRRMGYAALDSAAEPHSFESLMAEYGIGARAAAWQLWNLGLLSSEELRDGLIERYSAPPG
ncbi:MAG: hypothetical protein AB1505_27710 [Candidatus Latescibacterota bacterium]